jgi:hypothetical protein
MQTVFSSLSSYPSNISLRGYDISAIGSTIISKKSTDSQDHDGTIIAIFLPSLYSLSAFTMNNLVKSNDGFTNVKYE